VNELSRAASIGKPFFIDLNQRTRVRDHGPMPLGIHSHPGGMFDNSPTFQRWVNEVEASPVPKGRLRGWIASEVPSGLACILHGRSPALRRWAVSNVPPGQRFDMVYPTDLLPSMPLGIHSHPGGMFDISPTFQRWVNEVEASPVPKGRLRGWIASEVPSGLACILHDRSPALRRWACPSGTEV